MDAVRGPRQGFSTHAGRLVLAPNHCVRSIQRRTETVLDHATMFAKTLWDLQSLIGERDSMLGDGLTYAVCLPTSTTKFNAHAVELEAEAEHPIHAIYS